VNKVNKKRKKIKVKPFLFLLLLGFGLVVSGTFAYFYNEVIIPNQFKTMTYNVAVEEEFYDTWGTKKVSFVNKEDTNTPVVLRINYNEVWSKEVEDGVVVNLSDMVGGVSAVTKEWTTSFTNDFVLGDDGWYYYKKVLDANSSVQVLNSISLNESAINASPYKDDYKNYDYELSFNYEAIQATEDAVSSIWGHDITISGSDVTWPF